MSPNFNQGVEAAKPVSSLNGSYHKVQVSTIVPFLQGLTTHPRSCDWRKPKAHARQRRTPFWCQRNTANVNILNETSKPPLNIFSNILTYMIHKWLQFTLNMEKSIKLNLSKFHVQELKLACSIDRLYIGTIAFHFHTNAKI